MKYSKIVMIGFLCSATLLNAGWLDSLTDIINGVSTQEKIE